MLLPRLISVVQRMRLLPVYLAFAVTVAACPTWLKAQTMPSSTSPQNPLPARQPAQPQAVHLKDYSNPRSAFPNVLQPYMPQDVAPAEPGQLAAHRLALMQDGKIYLSIDDAVALALENNLDIDIARYNLNIADADLLRAKSGANILGVNTGIVQNTPGGGVGGLGGTVGLRHRRHYRRRRRRRHRHQRPGQFHARHRLPHHQLRSRSHRHAPTR